jgi:peptidoglycan/LPS O-acetylase OafA/YrhL
MMVLNRMKRIRLVSSFVMLATLVPLAIYAYIRWGDSLFFVAMIVFPIMVIGEWWQQWRYRNDPDWPRRPKAPLGTSKT